jgi:hypothetical protein
MGISVPTLQESVTKLLAWLGIYKISAKTYQKRISGDYRDQYLYHMNWFADNFSNKDDTGKPRIMAAPQRGIFKTALSQLVYYGY